MSIARSRSSPLRQPTGTERLSGSRRSTRSSRQFPQTRLRTSSGVSATATASVTRGGGEPPWLDEALAATCGSYPLRDVDHAASVEALRISDLVSRARFRQSAFYVSVMQPLGREHELKLWLPAPPGHARYFELERGPGRDFDERDRSFVSLLRPHLARLRTRWERRPHLPSLTERELDVLALVAQGMTNRQISSRLFISPSTVRTHLEHIYDKLGVRSRAGAVSAAFRSAS
jgi:DNA-binding CsgD family transcriptional regulator